MHKSAAWMAVRLAIAYAVFASLWTLLGHWIPTSPHVMMVDGHLVHHDMPQDLAFAALSTLLLFWLLRRYFLAQERVTETLRRSRDELEVRVQQRTHALDAERAKLVSILEAIPDGICIIDQHCDVTYVNSAMEQQWGPVAGRKCYTYLVNRNDPCPHCKSQPLGAVPRACWEWASKLNQRTYEVVGTTLKELGGEVSTLQLFRDVTERQLAADEQARLLAQIAAERRLFQAVVENTPDTIALFDGQDFRVRWTNQQFQQGLARALGAGTPVRPDLATLYPEGAGEAIRSIFSQVVRSGQPYVVPEYALGHPDGGFSYWQGAIIPMSVDANDAPDLLVVAHDITSQVIARKHIEEMNAEAERRAEELRRAHVELSSQARDLATLLEISRQMASTLQLQPLLDVILDQLQFMIDYSAAIIYTVDRDEGIKAVAYRGELPQDQVLGLYIPWKDAPGFQALHRLREPVIVNDLQSDAPLARAIMAAARLRFIHTFGAARSWLGVPLLLGEQVIGMLRLDHPEPGHFTTREAQIALAIASHAAVALENSRLYAEAGKVATLEERQRMARELHDSVSQALYGIALGAHAAREQIAIAPEKVGDSLDYILAMSATAVSEMRALVFELRPDSLEMEGLVAALAHQTEAVQARLGVTTRMELCQEPTAALPVKEALYRIAQEALQNIAKHARARHVNLRLCPDDGGLIVLEVNDDGIGFDPAGRFPGHLGLQSMRERATRLGGTVELESNPLAGTTVRARIPVAAESR